MLRLDNIKLDPTNPEAVRAVAFGKGKTGYSYSAKHAALAYFVTGKTDKVTGEYAVSHVTSRLTAAETAIAAGSNPAVAGDSYLGIGGTVEDIVLTLACCSDLVTPELIARAKTYIEQALFNIENPTKAFWGSRPEGSSKWTGWAINDPENNYNFHQTMAYVMWGLYSDSPKWMESARREVMALEGAAAASVGGGPHEGTGYGRARSALHRITQLWKENTNDTLPALTKEAEEDILFIIHATVPGFTHMVAVGDQSNESTHAIADGDRAWMSRALATCVNPTVQGYAKWWLNTIPLKKYYNALHCYQEFTMPKVEPIPYTGLSHHLETLGYYMVRSSWDADADYAVMTAGVNRQSHEAHDQGAFHLWSNRRWVFTSENHLTHSGIVQATLVGNQIVLYDPNGKPVMTQNRSASGYVDMILEMTASGAVGKIWADLSPAWNGLAKGKREWIFADKELVIRDTVTDLKAGYTYRSVLNSPLQPAQEGNTVTFGGTKVFLAGPPTIISWKLEEEQNIDAARQAMLVTQAAKIAEAEAIAAAAGKTLTPEERAAIVTKYTYKEPSKDYYRGGWRVEVKGDRADEMRIAMPKGFGGIALPPIIVDPPTPTPPTPTPPTPTPPTPTPPTPTPDPHIAEIAALKVTIQTQVGQINTLTAAGQTKDQEITRLTTLRQSLQLANDSLTKQVFDLQIANQGLNTLIEELRAKIRELEANPVQSITALSLSAILEAARPGHEVLAVDPATDVVVFKK